MVEFDDRYLDTPTLQAHRARRGRRPAAVRLARPGHVRRPHRGGGRGAARGVHALPARRRAALRRGGAPRAAARPARDRRPRCGGSSPSPGWRPTWAGPRPAWRRSSSGRPWRAPTSPSAGTLARPHARPCPDDRGARLRPPGEADRPARPLRARAVRRAAARARPLPGRRRPRLSSSRPASPSRRAQVAVLADGYLDFTLRRAGPPTAGSGTVGGRRPVDQPARRRRPLGPRPVGAGDAGRHHARRATSGRSPRTPRRTACGGGRPAWHATAYAVLGAVGAAARASRGPGRARPARTTPRTLLLRGRDRPSWPWPDDRLTYANAVLPESLVALGAATGDDATTRLGPGPAGVAARAGDRRRPPVPDPSTGRGPGDARPGFDQQPIEVTALAEACARAFARSRGDTTWLRALDRCVAWFHGRQRPRAAAVRPADGRRATTRCTRTGSTATRAPSRPSPRSRPSSSASSSSTAWRGDRRRPTARAGHHRRAAPRPPRGSSPPSSCPVQVILQRRPRACGRCWTGRSPSPRSEVRDALSSGPCRPSAAAPGPRRGARRAVPARRAPRARRPGRRVAGPSAAHRRVPQPGVRDRGGRAVQPVDGRAPRPDRAARRAPPGSS